MTQAMTLQELIAMRNTLMISQKELYVATIANVNARYRELLKNDFGIKLMKNCAWDFADTIANKYFDTQDLYLSPQQLYSRIVDFSHDDTSDPIFQDASIRKALYESQNTREVLKDISSSCQQAQKKLFEKQTNAKGSKEYIDKQKIEDGKKVFEEAYVAKHGEKIDDLSGVKESDGARIERDHVQPLATATHDERYITGDNIEKLKDFYTSSDNLQMLNKSANASKGDVRVFWDGEKAISEKTFVAEKAKIKERLLSQGMSDAEAEKQIGEKFSDITYKATAKQRSDAICDRWENASESCQQNLKNNGTLDENGKVPESVRKEMEKRIRDSINKEDFFKLKHFDYGAMSKDALTHTKNSARKIIMGQVIYYVLPPLVFETQTLVRTKGMTLDSFFHDIKKSGKRVVRYVVKHLGEIFKNLFSNGLNKFLKSLFDIIIEGVRETVKRLMKAAKRLVLSLVSCVRTIAGNGTAKEKADAVSKVLATTVTSVALEVLFEWAEKQYGLPDILMEPLQVIITILATNLIMLILEKVDLFDVQYGILVANIEQMFDEEYQNYQEQANYLTDQTKERMSVSIAEILIQMTEIDTSLGELNMYEDDATQVLKQLNDTYDMGLDFDKEWSEFLCNTKGVS